ncbi:hypothetical protein CYMTET_43635, partial [Cymbomonas tetramitiformis]
WWQCAEMVKRLFQCSLVVPFQIMVGEETDIVYAILVTVVAMMSQGYLHPYLSDRDDLLAIGSLCNEFMILFTVLVTTYIPSMSQKNSAIGGTLAGMQCAFAGVFGAIAGYFINRAIQR